MSEQLHDPWERWSWLVASVWLLFLAFPLLDVWEDPERALGSRLLVTGLVLAFAGVYVHGFIRLNTPRELAGSPRWRVGYLVGLVALAVGAALVIGTAAATMAVFVVSFAMFAVPLRVAGAVMVAAVALCLASPWLLGAPRGVWFVVPIIVMVGVATGLIRLLDDRQHEFRVLREDMSLVAERERVARDVHDVLGHSLTALTIKAELAERLVDLDPAAAKAELAQIRSLTREALGEVRATVGGLRIARLGEEMARARQVLLDAGVRASLPDAVDGLDPRYRLVAAWVLREAVTNVVRHSGAEGCEVRLEPARMVVADDGAGRGERPAGNGLRGLRERVAASGGELAVGDGPEGRGTVVEVTW